MSRPSPVWTAVAGTCRFPFGSRMTNIATHLDAITPVEVEHHPERDPGVTAQHVDQRWPLRRSDRGERVREELRATETAALTVEVTCDIWLTLIIDEPELSRVRLPFSWWTVQVVQCVADLVAHYVGRRRGPGAHDDLVVAVRARAGVPGRLARRQLYPVQPADVVEVGPPAGAHEDAVEPDGQLLLQRPRELGEAVDRGDHLGRRCGRDGIPLPPQDRLKRSAAAPPVRYRGVAGR